MASRIRNMKLGIFGDVLAGVVLVLANWHGDLWMVAVSVFYQMFFFSYCLWCLKHPEREDKRLDVLFKEIGAW